MGVYLLATTTAGLEEVGLREVEELTGRKAWVEHRGMLGINAEMENIFTLNLWARSLYRVFLVLQHARFDSLEDIYAIASALRVGDYITEGQSFAVRSERHGAHPFTSLDVARVVGQAIVDAYRAERGARLKVNLTQPDVIFRAEVRGERFWLALDTTGELSLGRRGYRVYQHPAALKPPLAYALVRLSGWTPDESLLDPMCGSGTIPIEAARHALGLPNLRWFQFSSFSFLDKEQFHRAAGEVSSRGTPLWVYGCDVSPKHVEGARVNAEKSGVKVEFFQADACATSLDYDRIIVNPPYGLRLGSRKKAERLYARFAENLRKHRWKSLVVITPSPELLLPHLAGPSASYSALHGGLRTTVLVYSREGCGRLKGTSEL